MREICFRKIKARSGEEMLLVFEQGEISNPILNFDGQMINRLNKEWKAKL